MAWTTPRDYVTNEILTAAILNVDHRDNLNVLSTHAHSGAAGNGNSSLTSLVKETFTDASAPAAPGSGLTAIYTVSGRPHFRAGSGGSDTTLAILADVHAQTHASAHQPGGADAMAVDASAGTGSLRTLGTGSTQGALGNHGHTLVEDVTGSTTGGLETFLASSRSSHQETISAGADLDIASTTNTFAAGSLAFGVACFHGGVDHVGSELKLRLMMGGVQVAESGYINIIQCRWTSVTGYRALSGSQACIAQLHSYEASNNVTISSLGQGNSAGSGLVAAKGGAIFVGSIEI
jgi:hypothetical protein